MQLNSAYLFALCCLFCFNVSCNEIKILLRQGDCTNVLLEGIFEARFEVEETIQCSFQPENSLLCESEVLGDFESLDYLVDIGRQALASIEEIDGVNMQKFGLNLCSTDKLPTYACSSCGSVAFFRPSDGNVLDISTLALALIEEVKDASQEPDPPTEISPDLVIDGETIFAVTGLILGVVSVIVLFVSRVNNEFQIIDANGERRGKTKLENYSTVELLIESNSSSSFIIVLEKLLKFKIVDVKTSNSSLRITDTSKTIKVYKSLDSTKEYFALETYKRKIGVKNIKTIETTLNFCLFDKIKVIGGSVGFVDFLCNSLIPNNINSKRISRRALPTNPLRSYLLSIIDNLREWCLEEEEDEEEIDSEILNSLIFSYLLLFKIQNKYEIKSNIRNFKPLFASLLFISYRLLHHQPITLRYWAEKSKISIDMLFEFESQFFRDSHISLKMKPTQIQHFIDDLQF